MSRISIANLKKTIYYLQRNGLRDTYLAALERFREKEETPWKYEPISEAEAEKQRNRVWKHPVKFSILVPAYKTDGQFLREMIESVLYQTYANFELIIADAGRAEDLRQENVETITRSYQDERIVYLPLSENAGISENTNAALAAATGDYIGLLDHDDVLTTDALYEMADQIEAACEQEKQVSMLYSDEDKCDETGMRFYEPHKKEEFNLDLILSNNYICHFLVIESSLMKTVGFRKEFDGAQDFDLVLQCTAELMRRQKQETAQAASHVQPVARSAWEQQILHIPKVLYHWRCHSGSTAVNPRSKMYAYESGGRAIGAFLQDMGWSGTVSALRHLGFYRVDYEPDVFTWRSDVGAVGGIVWGKKGSEKNKITGGIYKQDGTCTYKGLRKGFSGYMHKAALQQDAYAVDIRNMVLRPELWEVYKQVVGYSYEETQIKGRFHLPQSVTKEWTEEEYVNISLKLAEQLHQKGYRILWDPKI